MTRKDQKKRTISHSKRQEIVDAVNSITWNIVFKYSVTAEAGRCWDDFDLFQMRNSNKLIISNLSQELCRCVKLRVTSWTHLFAHFPKNLNHSIPPLMFLVCSPNTSISICSEWCENNSITASVLISQRCSNLYSTALFSE